MFYRFKSKLATQDRLEAFVVGVPDTDKLAYGHSWQTYEEQFKPLKDKQAIEGCKLFAAPKYDESKRGICLQFHPGKQHETVPDLWGVRDYLICSQLFRDTVEAVDDFSHQFIPMYFVDYQWQKVTTEQSYYWFNPRRFLTVQAENTLSANLDFIPIPKEEDFLGRVFALPALMQKLSAIPLWRHYYLQGPEGRASGARLVLYLNDELIAKLREAKVTGMDLYSARFGKREESLVKLTGVD